MSNTDSEKGTTCEIQLLVYCGSVEEVIAGPESETPVDMIINHRFFPKAVRRIKHTLLVHKTDKRVIRGRANATVSSLQC